MKKVALIVGGGINSEIAPPVQRIVAASGAAIDWERHDVVARDGVITDEQLDDAVEAVSRIGIGLKTRIISPAPGSGPLSNPNVALRHRLGLFAGVRNVRPVPGMETRFPDLDLLIVRENTEDIYKGIEHEIVPDVVESLKVVTRDACERIARFAFATAAYLGREQLTFVHKANIMKQSDGLFMRVVREVKEDYPQFDYRETIVDACCMQLVLDPYQFDVLLMGNLYGDILSSLCNGLTGGISSGMGVDIGDSCRMYEAIHGDAPDLVGLGVANPLPLLTPAISLLHHLDEHDSADRIESAVEQVLQSGTTTPDLGGTASTRELTDAIIAALG